MKQTKGKKSSTATEKKAIWSNAELLAKSLSIQVIEMENRLRGCELALQEYGDIATVEQSTRKILNDLDSGLIIYQVREIGKPNNSYFGQQLLDDFESRFKDIEIDDLKNIDICTRQLLCTQKSLDCKQQKIFDENVREMFEDFKNTNIREQKSLGLCINYCSKLISILVCDYFRLATDKEKIKIIMLENLVIKKSCEALGYWTAKLEMMIQNKENVKKRTTTKEKHKAELKEWMKTMKPRDCNLRAQKEFEVGERTILKYRQEIRDEETAIMRKKDVTA